MSGQPGPHGAIVKEPTTLKHENVVVAITENNVTVSVTAADGRTKSVTISRTIGEVIGIQ